MNCGGTFFVSAAQSAFVNKMLNTLPSTAPGVDPTTVIATGATGVAFTGSLFSNWKRLKGEALKGAGGAA